MSEIEKSLLSEWISAYYRDVQKGIVPTLTGLYDYLQVFVAANGKDMIELKKE